MSVSIFVQAAWLTRRGLEIEGMGVVDRSVRRSESLMLWTGWRPV